LRGDVAALRQADRPDDGSALVELRDQVAALQTTVDAMPRDATPSPVDARAVDDIRARLAELEQQTGGGQTDVAALEQSLTTLNQEVAGLSERTGQAASAERVTALEAEVAESARQAATASSLGAAVAADALASAVDAGRPFAAELAALRALGVDEQAVAQLDPHAQPGLPTLAGLRNGFDRAIEGIELSPRVPAGAGPLERLIESARTIVEVRPANPTEGADPAAIVTRIRAALAAGDLATATTEWTALPEDMKAATKDWAASAEARRIADDLVARLRADALSRVAAED
jgi:hypothetical protein